MGDIIRRNQMALRDAIATPAGKQTYVRRLFATIADRYDLITVVLSYGRDRTWKERLVAMASAGPGMRAVDLATGTGDIAFSLADAGAVVVGLDVTHRMIELANAKAHHVSAAPAFLVGDMIALPFAGNAFDLVTAGYGLRNVPDLRAAIDEIHRVLKAGGTMLSLDFNRPSNPIVRAVYLAYLNVTGAVLGWLLHRDPDTYRYIPASIRNYPGAAGVAKMLEAQGFDRVEYQPVLLGLMAIHVARKKS
jgi:demethylmenaquinone methyltransferase/2-methoxy-6-polyprenyl-1,4-benzoquinol methylase